ncbi:MAG: FAD-dependent oxidoreductase [Pseudonocardiales bacterium]|nr:FAD-dependent oxidoreductase [Pseudonocardiales bacterium]MBV9032667.1 FAD-dependent oxidoreductase [Pseudonocardiales bacterium]
MERTTCCVVGGGPAGMMLGLLLARAGVQVTVLEKHGDFLRDFRGDTVHPSTLTILDELGLGTEFTKIPHRLVEQLHVQLGDDLLPVADFRRVPGPHKHLALVPQWDLLELLADAGRAERAFTLRMHSEATGLLTEGGAVTGVRYRSEDGSGGELRADLTVACDGRRSVLRDAAGLHARSFGVPLDVWWFRLPRHEGDPEGIVGGVQSGQGMALLDRGDYFQCAYLIRKGSDAALRAEGIEALRRRVAAMLPWLAGRMGAVRDWGDVALLDVRLDRLRRWSASGLLCLGDAAHAMSPVGGVGINLAIQDAVAAARLLAGPLRRGALTRSHLDRVQLRRWAPTALTQAAQRIIHARLLGPVLSGDIMVVGAGSGRPWSPIRLLRRFPLLRAVPATAVGIGLLPEHAPAFAHAPAPAEYDSAEPFVRTKSGRFSTVVAPPAAGAQNEHR